MSGQIHLSVIVPVFNSAAFVERSLFTLDEFMRSLAYGAELIIVDDGSKDNSLEIAERWGHEKRPYHVQITSVGSNKGKGAAVAAGMFAAHGKFRVFLDADLAYHPSQILRMVEALEDGADVAVACRVHKDSRYTISPAFFHYLYTRHIASRLINFVMRHTIIKDCHDTQAGLKGFTADAARKIFSRQTVIGFPFDIEAIFLAQKMGYEVREVPIEFRYFSEPTTVAFLEDSLKMARDILRIRLNHVLERYNLPLVTGKKRLIVNADDFGMTIPVSQGILKCVASGIVRKTSVMVNSPEFDASMDEIIKNHADIGVGLHATFTWGRPLSPTESVPSLVEKDGQFLSRGKLLLRSLLGLVSEDEAYLELKAQCERLCNRWPNIGHIDGHHHAHIFPKICKAAERVAREFKIKYVRSPREGGWFSWHGAFFKRFLTRCLPASAPKYWRRRGFLTSDHFGGFSLSAGPHLQERWLKTIERLPNGATEIMVHPGYPSKNDDKYNKGREEEAAVLTDNTLVEKVKSAGIKICLVLFVLLFITNTAGAMNLSSSAITNGGGVPDKYACVGTDVSPPLKWTGAPAGTKSFAVIVDDPDAPAGTWVHWVAFNIPATATGLVEGASKTNSLPDGTIEGMNDFRKNGYNGPCPPSGSVHRYFFKIYALDANLSLSAGAAKEQVGSAMKGHVLTQAEFVGKFKR